MASTPLTTIYLRIEHSECPIAVLGLSSQATILEVREQYHALALRIHPDKAPSDDLRELYTSLFQKLQNAYRQLLDGYLAQEETGDDVSAAPKRLPETWASLHARNVAFREALRTEREKALSNKQAADALKAAKLETIQAKNERLAEKREKRALFLAEEAEKRTRKILQGKRTQKPTSNDAKASARQKASAKLQVVESSNDVPQQPQSADELLKACAEQEKAKKAAVTKKDDGQEADWKEDPNNFFKPLGTLRNTPAADTVTPMWDPELDERLVSDAEIRGRWNKQLLSGGRQGSVSLDQKKQRENNAAARIQKRCLALCEEAIRIEKPALADSKNKTFSGLTLDELERIDELEREAFVETELRAEARTDRMLMFMDEDVKRQYFLEEDEVEAMLGGREVDLLEYATASLRIEVESDGQSDLE